MDPTSGATRVPAQAPPPGKGAPVNFARFIGLIA
jgi:hypothetical protein